MTGTLKERNIIKEIFRDVINEVIREERINFYQYIIPVASQSEISNIEELYGSPENYKKEDFVDMTNWVKQ
jgi:hypothetical protein